MSCQQVTRLIPTTATPVSSEDPYVFTETVPTTPPILFNTQKSRTRVTDTQLGIAPATNIITPTTNTAPTNATAKLKHNQKSPLAHLNSHNNNNNNNNNTNNNNNNYNNNNNNNNATKTQASLAAANAANNISNNATTVAPAPPIFKHTTQSQNQQQQQQHQQLHNHQSKKALNVCIVRPQLQQQQPSPPHQPQQQQKLLQSRKQALSPPPLLQHTPSLWQTPLLLDTTSAVVSPPTSPASLPSPTGAATPVTCAASAGAAIATTATLVSCTGAATALVTPLMSTSAAPLPPSKFHHTTLAQHLQKVQCIKKPKKPAVAVVSNGVVGRQQQVMQKGKESDVEAKALTAPKSAPIPPSPAVARAPPPPPPPPLQAFDAPQHSETDLNEIPVNVIFRKPRADQPPPVQAADTLKKHNTPIAAATPVVSKLNNVKIITPTQKATPQPQPQTPVQTQPLSPPALAPASVNNNFTPAPNAMRDILFVHPNVNKTAPAHPPKRDTSSKANELQQPALVGASCTPPTQRPTPVKVAKLGKGSPPAGANFVPPLKATTTPKTAYKRKASAPLFAAAKGQTVCALPFAQKRGRKLNNIFSVSERLLPQMSTIGNGSCRAVAVVKLSAAEVDADTTQLASATVLPYCTQQHWLSIYADVAAKKRSCSRSFSPPVRNTGVSCFVAALAPNIGREDRITAHKTLLRRQALQLLATRSLQKLPLQAARRRLLCVDRLLRKYQQHTEDDFPPAKKCAVHACTNKVLELASHCQVHIASNATQHIFLPCSAKCADNTQCRLPVFDITHDLPLCVAHARKRTVLQPSNQTQQKAVVLPMFDYENESTRQQQLRQQYHQQQPNQHLARMQIYQNMNSNGSSTTSDFNHNNGKKLVGPRKRKTISMNSVGRPQKRTKKAAAIAPQTIVTSLASAPPTQLSSAVLQRKSSTTSLESIASNSQSSNSLPHYTPSTLALPALAPLSNSSNAMDVGVAANASQRMLNFGASTDMHSSGVESELRAHEINQIVKQFVVTNNDNNSIHNNNNNSCENSYHSNSTYHSNSSHNHHMHFMHHRNSDSNFTSALGSSSSLPTTEDLLKQELLSVCENSSAYASSEDTGLGGLSETELMAGAHDADDIPLVDSGLLEEHDLANALSSLPEDAFNELFTAVHQEERDEVERALELADKHLKSLQQTIGIDFLGDFADVHDGILADTDMCSKMGIISSSMHSSMLHSPDTSGIDTSTLFIDSGSNSAGAGSTGATGSCPAVVDIRGLVQT